MSATFVDTNVLVYAYDRDDPEKHERAVAVLTELWDDRLGVVSTQVLQEFYVTVTRKLSRPLSRTDARAVVNTMRHWPVQPIDADDIVEASELEQRHRLSFWDALIVTAAKRSGAERLLTEDLQHGRRIAGLVIENPFR